MQTLWRNLQVMPLQASKNLFLNLFKDFEKKMFIREESIINILPNKSLHRCTSETQQIQSWKSGEHPLIKVDST